MLSILICCNSRALRSDSRPHIKMCIYTYRFSFYKTDAILTLKYVRYRTPELLLSAHKASFPQPLLLFCVDIIQPFRAPSLLLLQPWNISTALLLVAGRMERKERNKVQHGRSCYSYCLMFQAFYVKLPRASFLPPPKKKCIKST